MKGLMEKLLIVLVLVGVALCDSDVQVLTEANFDSTITSGEWLLEFYAPWCGHCKNLAPIYEELATKVKGKYNIAKIDCTVEKGLQLRFAIRGFPTIKFLKDGTVYDFTGSRQVNNFVEFMDKGYKSAPSIPLPKPGAGPVLEKKKEGPSDVVVLTDSNFDEQTKEGTWFLKFYAPWCGHCKRLAPIWEDLATAVKGKVKVGKVDCTIHRGICAQYDVTGYPTLYFKKENELRQYQGPRTLAALQKFAEGGYVETEPEAVPAPLSGWQAHFHALLGHLDNISVNIYLLVIVCVVVGVLLGVCVVAMSPSPSSKKTIHYTPTPSSGSGSGENTEEITEEEVSKAD